MVALFIITQCVCMFCSKMIAVQCVTIPYLFIYDAYIVRRIAAYKIYIIWYMVIMLQNYIVWLYYGH